MKKTITLFALVLSFCTTSFAKNVNLATAQNAAQTFYTTQAVTSQALNKQHISLSLAYQFSAAPNNATAKTAADNLYYVFNVNANDGFVIISGDDVVLPILGYSNKGSYSTTNHSPAFKKWMENYKNQILYAKANSITATQEIKARWDELLNPQNNNTNQRTKGAKTVTPLVQTTWDQGNGSGYYNDACPADATLPDANNNSSHCVTGCPATAMGQILKYWNYPTMGSGFHSYNATTYGTLSANFGGTTYNWANMPNNVSSTNADVAQLMFHIGVAVEMNYTPDESGAYVIVATSPNATANCEYAYKTYFGYDPTTLQGLQRSNYSDAAWKALLKTELDANRPVQYDGFGTQGGHTFVCDGYDINDNFHMNWGWSGTDDGFYDLNALNPAVLGAGGGAGGFNSNQEAVIGIKPLTIIPTNSTIDLYSTITVTPNPIGFAQAFTVNADVINNGTGSFVGSFAAALFTTSGTFINFVQIDSTGGTPLAPGYHYTGGLTFSSNGMLTVPGNYLMGIYFKPSGGNWTLAGSGTFTNPVSVTIAGPYNAINLYSAITPSSTDFVQGAAASVNVNIINSGTLTYTGAYSADLYDLNGNFVQNIGQYSETAGLPAGNTYNTALTFGPITITANPGTYILAISEYDNTASTWYLAGTTYFTNPVNINVVAPAIQPDMYEVNNTEQTAYNFPLSFVSDYAHIITTGSNIHVGSDIDYYQVNLPAGYNYTITTRANDSYSSADGNTYTDDVLWSYDTGSGFGTTYDDVMPGNIIINGAGNVVFQVASYNAGTTGTYVLDIQINRVATALGISEVNNTNNLFRIYPNPTNSKSVVVSQQALENATVKLINLTGQTLTEVNNQRGNQFSLDLSNQPSGIYFVEVQQQNGMVWRGKVVKE